MFAHGEIEEAASLIVDNLVQTKPLGPDVSKSPTVEPPTIDIGDWSSASCDEPRSDVLRRDA